MQQSNVALEAHEVLFCREVLRPLGFRGYFYVDWAGSAGSGRTFYRLTLNRRSSAVLMLWHNGDRDWDYFLAMQQLRAREDLAMIPGMLAFDREAGLLMVEDGGDRRLRDIMFTGVSEYKKVVVLNSVVDELLKWQNCRVPEDSIISQRALDKEQFLWETSYFQEHLTQLIPELQPLFEDQAWEKERIELAELCDSLPKTLLHRDFQSENIVLRNLRVSFVDFQGARMGPPEYDLASLLYDPYLYPLVGHDVREEVISHYRESSPVVMENLYFCAAQRLMQALGAYGNLSCNKKKIHYRKFVYPALKNLSDIADHLEKFPKIKEIVNEAIQYWKKRS